MLFDDYVRDPTSVLKGTCEFLGVTPSVELPAVRANEGGQVWVSELARTAALNGPSTMVRRTVKRFAPGAYDRLRAWSRSTLMTTSAPLDPDLRRALTDACRPDVIRLQRLLGADLGHWLDG
jgi:hypothetical protein